MTTEPSSSADLEAIRKRAESATPGPWGYNSYSAVFSDLLSATYDNPETPDYPDDPRPGRTVGHTFFDEADNAWIAQRRAAYAADPVVASVPAEYGDTATGRHAADAEFIAEARMDIPALLSEVERLQADLEHTRQIVGAQAEVVMDARELCAQQDDPWKAIRHLCDSITRLDAADVPTAIGGEEKG